MRVTDVYLVPWGGRKPNAKAGIAALQKTPWGTPQLQRGVGVTEGSSGNRSRGLQAELWTPGHSLQSLRREISPLVRRRSRREGSLDKNQKGPPTRKTRDSLLPKSN